MKIFILALLIGLVIASLTFFVPHSFYYQPGTKDIRVTVRGLPLPYYETPKPLPIFGDVGFNPSKTSTSINPVAFATDILLWGALSVLAVTKTVPKEKINLTRKKLTYFNRIVRGVISSIFIILAYQSAEANSVYYSGVQGSMYTMYDYLCIPIVIFGLTAALGFSLKDMFIFIVRQFKKLRPIKLN